MSAVSDDLARNSVHFSPLTNHELMVRRAQAEDECARHMRAAVADEHAEDRELFLPLAEDSARSANEYDAALVQRIGWSPQGIGRDWGANV